MAASKKAATNKAKPMPTKADTQKAVKKGGTNTAGKSEGKKPASKKPAPKKPAPKKPAAKKAAPAPKKAASEKKDAEDDAILDGAERKQGEEALNDRQTKFSTLMMEARGKSRDDNVRRCLTQVVHKCYHLDSYTSRARLLQDATAIAKAEAHTCGGEDSAAHKAVAEAVTACVDTIFGTTPMPARHATPSSLSDFAHFNPTDEMQRTRIRGPAGFAPKWFTQQTGKPVRTDTGTMVLAPSGAGKSTYMMYQVAADLPPPKTPKAPVVTFLTKLSVTLGKGRWPKHPTDAKRLAWARQKLRKGVVAVIKEELKANGYVFAAQTHLVVCIDEIGALPGVMADEATWAAVADAILESFENVVAVHVAAGGTGAETHGGVLASDLDAVKKVRLPQWSRETLRGMFKGTEERPAAMWDGVLDVLCGESHGLAAALTNARMAAAVVRYMLDDKPLLNTVWDGKRVNATFLRNRRTWLLDAAVRQYVGQNGLSRLLQEANMPGVGDSARAVLRGVGLGALRATMNQATAAVQARGGVRPAPGSLDDVCAQAAERFGLLTSNFTSKGAVEKGRLGFEMHAGTVIVALHVVGLDVTELPPGWQGLEALTTLAATVASACTFALAEVISPAGSAAAEHFERVMPSAEPVLQALRWNAANHVTHSGDGKWAVPLPSDHRPVVPEDKASLPDLMAFRCLLQCKLTLATTASATLVNVVAEVAKAGLLKAMDATEESENARVKLYSSPKQRVILDSLARHWAEYEASWLASEESRAAALQRSAADFGPASASTLGERHLYPLNLLLVTTPGQSPQGVPEPITTWRWDNGSFVSTAAADALPVAQADAARRVPRRTEPAAQQVAARKTDKKAAQSKHTDWCEFRFVVNDLGSVRSTAKGKASVPVSRTLAVFERPSATEEWRAVLNGGLADGVADLRGRLRTDMALTLVAITVAHVCDVERLAPQAPAARGAGRDHGLKTPQKKHRTEGN